MKAQELTRQSALICLAALAVVGVAPQFGCDSASRVSAGVQPQANESSFDKERKAAEAGNASAQFNVAQMYDRGDGVKKDASTAYLWFLKAADSGNLQAMKEVYTRLERGLGVEQNIEAARVWIERAAMAGLPEAQRYWANKMASLAPDGELLIFGYPDIFEKLTVEQKQIRAREYVSWMEKARAAGDAEALLCVGRFRLFGVSVGDFRVAQNISEALELIEESARKNYWDAQWTLAILKQEGFASVAPNVEDSKKWWEALKRQDDPVVMKKIGHRYLDFGPYKPGKNKYDGRRLQTRGESDAVAIEWFKRATERGDVDAPVTLAFMARDKEGNAKSMEEALRFWRIAAERGHTTAQWQIGLAYVNGEGVTKDYKQAHDWFVKAANGTYPSWGIAKAMNALGVLYESGWGVEKDLVIAYAWLNLAAAKQAEKAKDNLARVEKQLKSDQIREAQSLSSGWSRGKIIARANAGPSAAQATSAGGAPSLHSSGTGFFVSADGKLLTNHHVSSECVEVRIPAINSTAKAVVADRANDLAILAVEGYLGSVAEFPSSDEVRQGEDIVVFGFPLEGYLPSSGNITPGIVSALAGPGNNASLIQLTAPVQPGNSGGPVLNRKGKVVGVVVGKADAIKVAKATGDIPQNVNFAIAGKTVRSFLDGNRVSYQKSGELLSFTKSSADIAEQARQYSVKIECWR